MDLTGKKYGYLTVIGPGERNTKGRYRWECKCDCGRIINTYASALISGKTKSCGYCLTKNWNPVDLTNMRFGRLVAIRPIEDDRKEIFWLCQCDCGNTIEVRSSSLRTGNTRSCGCLHQDFLKTMDRSRINHKKHGAFDKYGNGERLYNIWKGIKSRCNNINSESYKYYGGRGITVCEEWQNDYSVFRDWALSHGYNKDAERGKCTIDRIDNDKGYYPENCRFVSMSIQNKNKRKRGTVIKKDG